MKRKIFFTSCLILVYFFVCSQGKKMKSNGMLVFLGQNIAFFKTNSKNLIDFLDSRPDTGIEIHRHPLRDEFYEQSEKIPVKRFYHDLGGKLVSDSLIFACIPVKIIYNVQLDTIKTMDGIGFNRNGKDYIYYHYCPTKTGLKIAVTLYGKRLQVKNSLFQFQG